MLKRRMKKLALLILSATLAFAQQAPKDDDARQMKRFIDALELVRTGTADPVDIDQAFYQGAIPGLLRHLDPHSVFFDPGQFEQVKRMETSTQKGFGTVVSVLPGRVMVLQTLPNTPSAKSGMAPGDEILAVNNYRLDRLEFEQIIELLGQSKQKPAQLVVRRPGSVRLIELTLIPEEMQSPSVERAFLLEKGIAYVKVTSFEEKTGQQVREAIEKLGGENLQGLVLDLRANPGGLMTAAIQMASLFLKPGQTILSVHGRNVPETFEKVPEGVKPYTFPVAILVNSKTASASEIVSGALQDHDRATILGEPSFGKGLVQSVYPLAEKTGLALTTALYYIPSGRSIQKAFKMDEFALGATAAHPNERTDFKTDKGRPVPGGGGIVPDIPAQPESMTPFRQALEASAAFTSFTTEFIRGKKIDENFTVSNELLDQFRAWLNDRNIQPSVREWLSERRWLQIRLRAEIFNLTLGVAKGDEIEAQNDSIIQKALEAVKSK